MEACLWAVTSFMSGWHVRVKVRDARTWLGFEGVRWGNAEEGGKADVTGGLSSKSAESRGSRLRLMVARVRVAASWREGGLRRVAVRGVLSLEKAEMSASLPSSVRMPAGVLGASCLTLREVGLLGWESSL